MALQLDFSNAEAQRLRITQEQQRKIQELYKQASAEIARQAGKAPRVPSDALRKSYLNTLQGQIDERLRDIEAQLNGTVRSSMTAAASATVGDAKQFLQQNGLSIRGAYSHVPADIVNAVASGQLYSGNWTLSRALWLNTKETQQDVQNIIAQGIIQNKSAFDIAKDLEKYVDPTAKKDWDWSKVYPGTRRVVDYNAQRLARTMVSHAYQQAFVRTTQKNPFVKKYKWEASNSDRTCELCEERNGQLFDKDNLPLDHPNGMCTFTAVMDDMDTIGERLGDWAAGKDDPELDQWAKDIYGKGWEQKKEEVKPVSTRDGKWVDKTFKNLKKTVEATYGKDAWQSLQQDILSKPEEIQDWIQRWTGRIKFAQDDHAHYSGGTIYESMVKDALGKDRAPFSTFYHELGHHIDMYGRGRNGIASRGNLGKEFHAILTKEYQNLIGPDGYLLKGVERDLLSKHTDGVQDTISGLGLNKDGLRWGHSTEYWTRKGADSWQEVTSETFANMNRAYCNPGSDGEVYFKKYFPESYQYFIDTYVKDPKVLTAKG